MNVVLPSEAHVLSSNARGGWTAVFRWNDLAECRAELSVTGVHGVPPDSSLWGAGESECKQNGWMLKGILN